MEFKITEKYRRMTEWADNTQDETIVLEGAFGNDQLKWWADFYMDADNKYWIPYTVYANGNKETYKELDKFLATISQRELMQATLDNNKTRHTN